MPEHLFAVFKSAHRSGIVGSNGNPLCSLGSGFGWPSDNTRRGRSHWLTAVLRRSISCVSLQPSQQIPSEGSMGPCIWK